MSIRMAFSSVIVLIVNIHDFVFLNPERQTPVARDVQAPDPVAAAGELVGEREFKPEYHEVPVHEDGERERES